MIYDVPEGLEGGLGGNTVRVLVLPNEIFSSTPTSCYIMKSSLAFLRILWFYTMLRSEIFTCAKTYVLIDPLLCNKNTTASHSRFTLELLTPGGLLLHVCPLLEMCGAVVSDMNPFWFWAKRSASFSHWMYQNTWKIPQKVFEFIGVQSEEWFNSKIFGKTQDVWNWLELDVHHVSPKCGLVCLSHHIWYHKNPSLRLSKWTKSIKLRTVSIPA